MRARVKSAATALRALDAVIAQSTSLPELAEVAIVGAGLAGILVASTFVETGANPLAVIEKSPVVGGTWRHHGNAFSRVNSSEPSYRLHLSRE